VGNLPNEKRALIRDNKGKVVPVYTIKAYRMKKGVSPLILNLGTRRE
jgi:hypothetical protein